MMKRIVKEKKKELHSHPIGCREMKKLEGSKCYEVKLVNHETLDSIVIFKKRKAYYHLDLLYNDDLTI